MLEGEKEAPKLDDALGKLFRDEALAAGLTQAQYNRMVRSGNKIIAQAVGQASGQGQGQARAELIKHYGSEDGFKQAAARAYQGFAAFADDADMKAIDSIGDLPVFIRVFDRIAAELGEDKLPNFNPDKAAGEVAEIDRLTRDTKSEYWDSKKPGHAAAVAKVAAWNERQVAQKNRKLA